MLKKGFFSTKTYTHAEGLSCCFRQWRAESHCSYLHGYALQITLEFQADELNWNKWVVDFGGLKPIKQWLHDTFDHRTIVAVDDPKKEVFQLLSDAGLINMLVIANTGCEGFADFIYGYVANKLANSNEDVWEKARESGVRLSLVEVREHAGNSAGVYTYDDPEEDAKRNPGGKARR